MAKSKKETQVEKQADTSGLVQDAPAVEQVQLTIADLQLLSRVVDLASRRGAFQANEMTQVGVVFDKLTGFLAYVESTQAANSEEITNV